jgi:hypothetical protein
LYPFKKNGDKTDCVNYRGISLLATTYKILSDILSRLTPNIAEIIVDHQCGLRRKRSTTDQIFCSCHKAQKKWEYNGIVYKLFTDFEKAYVSVKREVFYNFVYP